MSRWVNIFHFANGMERRKLLRRIKEIFKEARRQYLRSQERTKEVRRQSRMIAQGDVAPGSMVSLSENFIQRDCSE